MSSKKKSLKNNKNLIAIPTTVKSWLENKFVSFYENVVNVFQSNKDIKKNLLILAEDMHFVFKDTNSNVELLEILSGVISNSNLKKEIINLFLVGDQLMSNQNKINKIYLDFIYKVIILFFDLLVSIKKKHFAFEPKSDKGPQKEKTLEMYTDNITYLMVSLYIIKHIIGSLKTTLDSKKDFNKTIMGEILNSNLKSTFSLISNVFSNDKIDFTKVLLSSSYLLINLISSPSGHFYNLGLVIKKHANWAMMTKSFSLSRQLILEGSRLCDSNDCHSQLIKNSFESLDTSLTIYNHKLSPEKRIIKWFTNLLRDDIDNANNILMSDMTPMIVTSLKQVHMRLDKLEQSLKKNSRKKLKSSLEKKKN